MPSSTTSVAPASPVALPTTPHETLVATVDPVVSILDVPLIDSPRVTLSDLEDEVRTLEAALAWVEHRREQCEEILGELAEGLRGFADEVTELKDSLTVSEEEVQGITGEGYSVLAGISGRSGEQADAAAVEVVPDPRTDHDAALEVLDRSPEPPGEGWLRAVQLAVLELRHKPDAPVHRASTALPLPDLSAESESHLWFSPLVDSRETQAILLHQGIARLLAEQDDERERAIDQLEVVVSELPWHEDAISELEDQLEVLRELTGLTYPALATSVETGAGMDLWLQWLRDAMDSRRPAVPPDAQDAAAANAT